MDARTRVPARRAERRRYGPVRALLGLLAVAPAVLALLVGLLAGAGTAAAQDSQNPLVESEPADGDTLGASPEVLRFTFQNEVDPDDVLTAPLSCGNQPQQTGTPTRDPDDERIVTVEVIDVLPRGACTISWSLRNVDGETISGPALITFSVQADPATTPTEPTGSTPTTTPASGGDTDTGDGAVVTDGDDEGSTGGALWLGRVLSTTGVLIVFGALALVGTAWPEGPEYVITVRFLRSMWALALVGTVLFVIAFTADATGRSFGASISPGTWLDLLDEGTPGRAALARLAFVVLTGWVVLRPERVIDPTTQLAAYGLPGLAVIAVGLSRTGDPLALVGIVMGVGHALASAVWIGGAVLVARVVLAGPGDDDLVHAVRGFNRISAPAIAVTVGTGVVQLLRLDGGSLFSSGHGRVLLLKTVVVAALVFVAMTTRQMAAARLARAHEMTAPLADRFRRAFTAEALVGVVVLGLSGWLLALTPPRVEAENEVDYEISRPFVDEVSGLDLEVFVTPARVGLNGIRVEVEAPQEGISNLVVSFLPPEGSDARGIDQPIPLTTAGTAVLDVEDGIPFDVPGTWTIQVSGTTSTGTLTGAASSFPVIAADGSADTGGTTPDVTTPPAGTTTADGTGGGTIITVIVDPNLDTSSTTPGG